MEKVCKLNINSGYILIILTVLTTGKPKVEWVTFTESSIYRVFHRFRQAKFADGGSILSWSQFLLLPQQELKKNIKNDINRQAKFDNGSIILS
jgi:hypothetical protein